MRSIVVGFVSLVVLSFCYVSVAAEHKPAGPVGPAAKVSTPQPKVFDKVDHSALETLTAGTVVRDEVGDTIPLNGESLGKIRQTIRRMEKIRDGIAKSCFGPGHEADEMLAKLLDDYMNYIVEGISVFHRLDRDRLRAYASIAQWISAHIEGYFPFNIENMVRTDREGLVKLAEQQAKVQEEKDYEVNKHFWKSRNSLDHVGREEWVKLTRELSQKQAPLNDSFRTLVEGHKKEFSQAQTALNKKLTAFTDQSKAQNKALVEVLSGIPSALGILDETSKQRSEIALNQGGSDTGAGKADIVTLRNKLSRINTQKEAIINALSKDEAKVCIYAE
ncbi:MAG: hypothetical protein HY537_11445 [Deltaproteobacteria bacterium]|nr:hypothetical protein [Deltaproteobacteria bacterium]